MHGRAYRIFYRYKVSDCLTADDCSLHKFPNSAHIDCACGSLASSCPLSLFFFFLSSPAFKHYFFSLGQTTCLLRPRCPRHSISIEFRPLFSKALHPLGHPFPNHIQVVKKSFSHATSTHPGDSQILRVHASSFSIFIRVDIYEGQQRLDV